MKKNIAVLEGDGIGPEIMREGLKVLDAIARKHGHSFTYIPAPFGAKAYFDYGHPFPEQTKGICDGADAVMKGPVGLALSEMNRIPTEMSPEPAALLPLRKRYETYANYRPVFLPKSCADFSPLKPDRIGEGLDILMMRELVGGIYFGEKIEGKETKMQYARDVSDYTAEQIERFAHVCFNEARQRNGQLTSVHKANVLATSRFWNQLFESISVKYPDVNLKSMLVDNVAYQLSVNPTQFNGVMALDNMQGDILTDQAGGILGSLGLMPSACLNLQTGKGYYEPAHGSAPDIAGQNIANPYSMIGSVALMLEKSFGLGQESRDVWAALTNVFAEGYRTKELSRNTPLEKVLSTSQFGDKVAEKIMAS
ncbi:3-isopropylmalate dehydrogenase [Candidatus Woesearchaeota archaeon]|nr:3-isopropylmalate dehydrogenase [Candidatus Woesearchaeota archaeon]